MSTETWVRGKITNGEGFRYRTRKSGVLSAWTHVWLYSNAMGRSEVVTSERNWPKNPYSNVEDFYNVHHSGTTYRGLSSIDRVKARRRYRAWLKNRPKPMNGFSRSFKGIARNDDCYSGWLPRAEAYGGGDLWMQGKLPLSCLNVNLALSYVPAVPASAVKGVESRLFVKATQPGFDAYTQVGELLETLAMLRAPLKALRELATGMWHSMRKQTHRLKGPDLQEALAGAWLEWSFGISPLIFGTAEIASNLVDAMNPHTMNLYDDVRSKVEVVLDESTRQEEYLMPSFVWCRYTRTIKVGYVVRGGLRLAPRLGSQSLAARFGLNSMRAIVSQAYALLPLSFAVDWIVGIGPLLDSCRPLDRRIVQSYVTSAPYYRNEVALSTFRPDGLGLSHRTYGTASFVHSTTTRMTAATNPGSLQLGPLLFSLSQGLSGAALAAGPISSLWRKLPWH